MHTMYACMYMHTMYPCMYVKDEQKRYLSVTPSLFLLSVRLSVYLSILTGHFMLHLYVCWFFIFILTCCLPILVSSLTQQTLIFQRFLCIPRVKNLAQTPTYSQRICKHHSFMTQRAFDCSVKTEYHCLRQGDRGNNHLCFIFTSQG